MKQILNARNSIYNYFRVSKPCQEHFYKVDMDAYAAYYTSMYLIQDTGEALLAHRKLGFSDDSMRAYIEFWGVMQAIFIQQDALKELYKAVFGGCLDYKKYTGWMKLRDIRNLCAGHPAKQDRPGNIPHKRTFMGRNFGDYKNVRYELWDNLTQLPTHPEFDLCELIDKYEADAVQVLQNILSEMKRKWPAE
ncbi:MAG: hypothetical protein ACE5EN_08360 [Nitrospinota bacterium]